MRNRREVVKKQRMAAAVIVAVICILIGSVLFGAMRAKAASAVSYYKYYTSIQVQKGDTLWKIADTYRADEYVDRNAYIEEICSINHVTEHDIHAGQYLTIPYYSIEYQE